MEIFQFHSGAIKTLEGEKQALQELLFQFHSGAIKTRSGVIARRVTESDFNSTLVRLKP